MILEAGGPAGMKAVPFLQKRCGTIRNYHGNQRLAQAGLRFLSTKTESPAVLFFSPLAADP